MRFHFAFGRSANASILKCMDIKLDSAQLPALSPGQQLCVGRMLCCGPAVLPCTSPHFSSAHSLPEARYARSPMEGTAAATWTTGTYVQFSASRLSVIIIGKPHLPNSSSRAFRTFLSDASSRMTPAALGPESLSTSVSRRWWLHRATQNLMNIGSTVLRELVRQQSHVFTCCASEIPLGIT